MGSKASKPNRHEGSRSSAAGGLVEVRISHAVTWSEARLLAEQTAGGLPTCDELRAAGVTAGDGVDLWMPVRRPDGREGDYCQIGNHPMNRTRYISHIDAYGMPAWFTNKNPAGWRPGPASTSCKGIIYARAKAGPTGAAASAVAAGDSIKLSLSSHRGQGLVPKFHGRHSGPDHTGRTGRTWILWSLDMGGAAEAVQLVREGPPDKCRLRWARENVCLEVNCRKMEKGNMMFLWNDDPPVPAGSHSLFRINADRSISPHPECPGANGGDPTRLALGLRGSTCVLVGRDDPKRLVFNLGGVGSGSASTGAGFAGDVRTLDMAHKDGRGGFKIHPVLAVTGRTVGGKEELVPGFVDPGNHVNHSLNYHKAMYKAVKGHALPKGEKLGDEHAVGWMDASSPRNRNRAQPYTGPVHMGICKNYDGNGNWIYGDIIGDVMWYEWWGCHQTRDFQYAAPHPHPHPPTLAGPQLPPRP